MNVIPKLSLYKSVVDDILAKNPTLDAKKDVCGKIIAKGFKTKTAGVSYAGKLPFTALERYIDESFVHVHKPDAPIFAEP